MQCIGWMTTIRLHMQHLFTCVSTACVGEVSASPLWVPVCGLIRLGTFKSGSQDWQPIQGACLCWAGVSPFLPDVSPVLLTCSLHRSLSSIEMVC